MAPGRWPDAENGTRCGCDTTRPSLIRTSCKSLLQVSWCCSWATHAWAPSQPMKAPHLEPNVTRTYSQHTQLCDAVMRARLGTALALWLLGDGQPARNPLESYKLLVRNAYGYLQLPCSFRRASQSHRPCACMEPRRACRHPSTLPHPLDRMMYRCMGGGGWLTLFLAVYSDRKG